MQENFTILAQRAALEHPAFLVNPWLFCVPEDCLASILKCRLLHGMLWVLQEAFWKGPPARERPSSAIFEKSRNLATSSCELRPATTRKNIGTGERSEARAAELIHQQLSTLSKRGWSSRSHWWNSFSQLCDRLSEISRLGNAFCKKCPRLYGISKLESELQDWEFAQWQLILISQCTGSKKVEIAKLTGESMTSR